MSDLDAARRFAMSLPGATEEPHFDLASFRVRGKIFATVPPGEAYLHAFLDEPAVDAWVAENPAGCEPLLWGQRVRGIRVSLAACSPESLAELIEESWRRKAPKALIEALDNPKPRA
ncbi:MAG TPA: MmcQ/YjbR family DNA-binding protein [Streptosporangiaceae bacterium]|nr:MmcQ/YjbR family DNA-binding protein [Streptosporangiaceae bacterium]